jgi:hypothetical protein
MKDNKYHTVGTVQKISHCRDSSKNITLSEQFQNPIEKSHQDNRYTKHTYIWPLDFLAWNRDYSNMWRLKASFTGPNLPV